MPRKASTKASTKSDAKEVVLMEGEEMLDEAVATEEAVLEDAEVIGVKGGDVELSMGEEAQDDENVELPDVVTEQPAETKFTKEQEEAIKQRADEEDERIEKEAEDAAKLLGKNAPPDAIDLSAKGFNAGGRNAKRHLYSGAYVHAIGERPEFETATETMRNKRSEYIHAAKSYHNGQGYVMEGQIVAADDKRPFIGPDGTSVRIPYCKIIDGPIVVYIPITQLTRLRTDVKGNAYQVRTALRSLANARIGSVVKYMVTNFDETKREAIGTRLPVLDMEKRINYQTRLKRTNDYVLHEGEVVEARVIFQNVNHLGVEVFGVEESLGLKDITYSRTGDLGRYFEKKYGTRNMIGKTVPVKIMELRRSPELYVHFSMKEGSMDQRRLDIMHLDSGDTVLGEVVSIVDAGIYATIQGTEVDCLCSLERDMRIPNIGDIVSLHLNNVDKERLLVSGFIRKQL